MKILMLHLKIGLYLLEMCNSYRLWTQDFDIVMPMSNLIEYSDNYSDTSGRLWQFKRDESSINDARNSSNVSPDDLSEFKFKSSFFKKLTDHDNEILKNVKIAVPLK